MLVAKENQIEGLDDPLMLWSGAAKLPVDQTGEVRPGRCGVNLQ
jgi:hypothetical protein